MGTTSVAHNPSPVPRPQTDPPPPILSKPGRRFDASMTGSLAGWYYDPEDQAVYRYWDGNGWTEFCCDVFPAAQPTLN